MGMRNGMYSWNSILRFMKTIGLRRTWATSKKVLATAQSPVSNQQFLTRPSPYNFTLASKYSKHGSLSDINVR